MILGNLDLTKLKLNLNSKLKANLKLNLNSNMNLTHSLDTILAHDLDTIFTHSLDTIMNLSLKLVILMKWYLYILQKMMRIVPNLKVKGFMCLIKKRTWETLIFYLECCLILLQLLGMLFYTRGKTKTNHCNDGMHYKFVDGESYEK